MDTTTQGWTIRTINPGDRIADYPQTIEEKARQIAVDAPDITGDRIRVPTYFIVEYPNGEKKALHHVRDAKEISDVVRQIMLYDAASPEASPEETHQPANFNLTGIILVIGLFLMTALILVGLF